MAKKNVAKHSKAKNFLATVLIIALGAIASISGIYCAKVYTTPYSMELLSTFDEDTLAEVDVSEEKCNILIMGVDKSGNLTDVLMLAQVDPDNEKISVMSIPRDSRVNYKGKWMKINSVHSCRQKGKMSGCEATILAVKDLVNIPINHFVKVNFNAFDKSIDELGGVDFDVPQNMNYDDPYQDLHIHLKKGKQHLSGDQAEQLVRFRRYKNGDIDRIKVQQDFLHALAEQKLKVTNIGKAGTIYDIIAEDMETSMTPDDAIQVATAIVSIGKDKIETFILPNTPEYIGAVSYVIPNEKEMDLFRKKYFGYDANGNEISKQ